MCICQPRCDVLCGFLLFQGVHLFGFVAQASIHFVFPGRVASSRACRELPVHQPHLGLVACSLLFPPRMRWSLKLCGGIIFWCPDVVSTGFSNLWTRNKEQACRVEAYNLPDLLLICFLKPRGQSMLILTLVINTLCPHSLHKSILGHKCDWCYFVFSFFFFLHDVTDQIFWFCLFFLKKCILVLLLIFSSPKIPTTGPQITGCGTTKPTKEEESGSNVVSPLSLAKTSVVFVCF